MYRLLPLICFFSLLFFYSPAQTVKEKVERLMDGFSTRGEFNGAVIVARHGGVVLEKAYGYRNQEKKEPHTVNSVFRAGSATEILTAEIILGLDSKGKISLDERLIKYFPDHPVAVKITVKNLLTHTSGIHSHLLDSAWHKSRQGKKVKLEEVVEMIMSKPLSFAPGDHYEYNVSNYILLGYIIDKVAGQDYEDIVRDKILQVCGMRLSGFDAAAVSDEFKTTGYDHLGSGGKMVPVSTDLKYMNPATGLYTTAGDLYKFHQALHWYKLLPKDWQELAYTPLKDNAALGWRIERLYNKRFMIHESKVPGYSLHIIRQEEDDLFIALLSNAGQPSMPLSTIAGGLLRALYGAEPKKEVEKKKENARPDPGMLHLYVGEFDFSPTFFLQFSVAGNTLVAETPEQKVFQLIPEGPGKFSMNGIAAQLEFIKDKSGKFNKVILYRNGQQATGERLK